MREDRRMYLMKLVTYETGFSLDLLVALSRGLDAHALRILCGNVSDLPKNRKSKDVP